MRFIGQHNLLFKARRNNFGLRLHAFAATHRTDNAQNCDALTNICRYEFCLFDGINFSCTTTIVKTHRNRIFAVHSSDFPGYRSVIGHRTRKLRAPCIESFTLQNLSNCGCCIAGIHVLGAGTDDRGTGLIMSGDTFSQRVRCYRIGCQVQLCLFADNHFVNIFICHNTHLLKSTLCRNRWTPRIAVSFL